FDDGGRLILADGRIVDRIDGEGEGVGRSGVNAAVGRAAGVLDGEGDAGVLVRLEGYGAHIADQHFHRGDNGGGYGVRIAGRLGDAADLERAVDSRRNGEDDAVDRVGVSADRVIRIGHREV